MSRSLTPRRCLCQTACHAACGCSSCGTPNGHRRRSGTCTCAMQDRCVRTWR